MPKVLAAVILLAAGHQLASVVLSADESSDLKPAWLNNYQDALRAARRAGKPLFVVFRCPH